jgi:NTP pyrophosphatase (non-canonical NTP hydrolase)
MSEPTSDAAASQALTGQPATRATPPNADAAPASVQSEAHSRVQSNAPSPGLNAAALLPANAASSSDRETTVWQLREVMQQFVRERSWEQFHNARNLAMSLAIEAGELMEHFQWHTTSEVVAGERLDREGIRDELADVICYALSLANALDIDIAQAIEQKMVKNRTKYPAP